MPGKNPAQGDQLKATYVYADPDNDQEDLDKRILTWSAAGAVISGSTTDTFTPVAAQNKKFLSFAVTPGSMPPADPDKAVAPTTSPETLAPVLPSRTQLAGEYTNVTASKSWGDAYMHCAGLNARLPSVAELQTLFTTYTRANAVGEDSQNDINKTYGWGNVHWTSAATVDRGTYVYLGENGRSASNLITNRYIFACAKFGTPEGLPSVTGVSIPNASVGNAIVGLYTYNGNSTIPDRSRFQWYTATASDGTTGKTAIAGATNKSYTPVAGDSGKWLALEITPASYDTVVGTIVSAVGMQVVTEPPTATNVRISGYDQWGTPQIGGVLRGEYDFNANGGNTIDASTYRWINGAANNITTSTYTLNKSDAGKILQFQVTPKNGLGEVGAPAVADAQKRVSTLKLFRKPNKNKYSAKDLPSLKPPYADPASRECRYSTSYPIQRLPTRAELTTLFADEAKDGPNNAVQNMAGHLMRNVEGRAMSRVIGRPMTLTPPRNTMSTC